MKTLWCEQRLEKNRSLIIIATIAVLLTVALVASLAVVIIYKDKLNGEAVCTTPGCVKAASAILKNLNPEIEPCDNFYEFACGGYAASTQVPFPEFTITPFAQLEQDTLNQLRSIIEEPGSPDEPRHFQLARTFYRDCVNISALEKAGLEPLEKILDQFGNWPVLAGNDWKEDDFNWMESVYLSGRLGYSINSVISLSVSIDWQNSSQYVIMVDRASFGLSRNILIQGLKNEVSVKPYLNYMVDIAVLLGADRNRAAQELRDSLDFEMKLANISLSDAKRENITLLNNPMTLAEMTRRYPIVNWTEYLDNLLPSTVRVDADEVIIVVEPDFIGGLEKILKNTPKRVQANYVVWRAVAASVIYLNQNVRKRQIEYVYEAGQFGSSRSLYRWKQCMALLSGTTLSYSVNALYVRKHFNEETKRNVVEMVTDIKQELVKVAENANWMDNKTRGEIVEKAKSLLSLVGHPVELLDDKKLEMFYTPLYLSEDSLLGNALRMSRLSSQLSFELLRKPVVKNEWVTHSNSIVANAFYDPSENSIQIPAGLLQGTFFGNEHPRYMNYGATGFLIGHEVTHSFDIKRRGFDSDGSLVVQWSPETTQKYLEKVQCLIDQYSNYTVKSVGRNVDGNYTLNENWADNGGVKKAYLAYKEYVKRNGPEAKLPGLKYTQEQMFWISAASIWCTKYLPEAAQLELTADVHSPNRFRVIGSFSNSQEFADDFNCPLGSNMNPVHKCSVL